MFCFELFVVVGTALMISGQGGLMSAEVRGDVEGGRGRRGVRDEGPHVERQKTQHLASEREGVSMLLHHFTLLLFVVFICFFVRPLMRKIVSINDGKDENV